MERKIITTEDGSHTVEIPEMNVTYHSHHGAIQESMHVFIEAGLRYQLSESEFSGMPLSILEMGFGTGLNAFLTALEAENNNVNTQYTAVEKFPLSLEETRALNYFNTIGHQIIFDQLHECPWGQNIAISEHFILCKEQTDLCNFTSKQLFNLVYFDAFDPAAQPELWTEDIFKMLFKIMTNKGILLTYCSKSSVRKAMQTAGFMVTKLPGPPGKREIVRCFKSI